jgi:hypothetical protein
MNHIALAMVQAMGSLLLLVIANFFMEDFIKVAISRTVYKPICWFSYVDNMFMIWPHGPGKLNNFLNHLSSIHLNI